MSVDGRGIIVRGKGPAPCYRRDMLILGIILIVVSLTVFPSHLLLIIGIILAVLGFFGNGYAHWGPAPASGRRRYFY